MEDPFADGEVRTPPCIHSPLCCSPLLPCFGCGLLELTHWGVLGGEQEDPINEAEELGTEENTGVQPHGPEEELELPDDMNLDGDGMEEKDNGAAEVRPLLSSF
jgi:hypothetical protein